MTNNISFIKIIAAEAIKIRKNIGFIAILFIPLIFTLAIPINYVIKNEDAPITNGWEAYIYHLIRVFYILYPFIIATFVYSYVNIENENRGFKLLFTIPISKCRIYFAKVVVIIISVAVSILISYLFFLLSGNILTILYPSMGFQECDIWNTINLVFIKFTIICFSIAMIQFAASLLHTNFVFSNSIPIICFVLSSLGLKMFDYVPYIYINEMIFLTIFKGTVFFTDKLMPISMLYMIVFMMIGFVKFRKLKA